MNKTNQTLMTVLLVLLILVVGLPAGVCGLTIVGAVLNEHYAGEQVKPEVGP